MLQLNENRHGKIKTKDNKTVLLGLLSLGAQMLPLIMLACLKRNFEPYGHSVHTLNAYVDLRFKEFYNRYFNTLKIFVAMDKRGYFYTIAHNLMQNHKNPAQSLLEIENSENYVDDPYEKEQLIVVTAPKLEYTTFCF